MDNTLNMSFEPDFEVLKAKLLVDRKENNNVNKLSINELFKPFFTNNLNFKNHFVFCNLTDNEFFECEDLNFGEYYFNVAKSNVGLIITGGIDFSNLNRINVNKKSNIEKFKNYINKVHTLGTKIFLQIKEFYGRGIDKNKFLNKLNYSASFNRSVNDCSNICMRFSDFKCNELIYEIKSLCRFAENVGFDGVLINGDMYNILGEFSSFEFNRRYFGYYSNIGELQLKLLHNLNNEFKNFNIFYSITLNNFLNKTYKNNLKKIKTTAKISRITEFKWMCEFLIKLVNLGVCGFVFNFGTFENEFFNIHNEFQDEYLFYDYYKEIKDLFSKQNIKNKFGDDVILIYKDNINNINKAELYLKNNTFGFLDVTKQLYADNKYLINKNNDVLIRPCTKCGYCDYISKEQGINSCLINPEVFSQKLNKVSLKHNNNVAIIGGGLSGLMCAIYLLERGFYVDIYDKNDILNKRRKNFEIFDFCKLTKNFNDYIDNLLIKNANNCQIYLKTDIKHDNILINKEYRAIIVATGSHEKFLNILGSVLKSVVSLYDVLTNKKIINNNHHFILYAKSELSLNFALYLLKNKKQVSLIFSNFDTIKNISNDRFTYYFYELTNLNANIYINARVKKIEHDFIELIINSDINKQNILSTAINLKSNSVLRKNNKLVLIDYDCFVYEPDLTSNNKLYYDIVSSSYKGEVYMIGNALKICDDAECIKSAYFVAKNL
ncbi:MAG: NAD(P)-binding protein [Clostridia bacterium]|nr:NAD(P)-binding protein [Clostridia bacterium]